MSSIREFFNISCSVLSRKLPTLELLPKRNTKPIITDKKGKTEVKDFVRSLQTKTNFEEEVKKPEEQFLKELGSLKFKYRLYKSSEGSHSGDFEEKYQKLVASCSSENELFDVLKIYLQVHGDESKILVFPDATSDEPQRFQVVKRNEENKSPFFQLRRAKVINEARSEHYQWIPVINSNNYSERIGLFKAGNEGSLKFSYLEENSRTQMPILSQSSLRSFFDWNSEIFNNFQAFFEEALSKGFIKTEEISIPLFQKEIKIQPNSKVNYSETTKGEIISYKKGLFYIKKDQSERTSYLSTYNFLKNNLGIIPEGLVTKEGIYKSYEKNEEGELKIKIIDRETLKLFEVSYDKFFLNNPYILSNEEFIINHLGGLIDFDGLQIKYGNLKSGTISQLTEDKKDFLVKDKDSEELVSVNVKEVIRTNPFLFKGVRTSYYVHNLEQVGSESTLEYLKKPIPGTSYSIDGIEVVLPNPSFGFPSRILRRPQINHGESLNNIAILLSALPENWRKVLKKIEVYPPSGLGNGHADHADRNKSTIRFFGSENFSINEGGSMVVFSPSPSLLFHEITHLIVAKKEKNRTHDYKKTIAELFKKFFPGAEESRKIPYLGLKEDFSAVSLKGLVKPDKTSGISEEDLMLLKSKKSQVYFIVNPEKEEKIQADLNKLFSSQKNFTDFKLILKAKECSIPPEEYLKAILEEEVLEDSYAQSLPPGIEDVSCFAEILSKYFLEEDYKLENYPKRFKAFMSLFINESFSS